MVETSFQDDFLSTAGYIALGIRPNDQALYVLSVGPNKQKCIAKSRKQAKKGMEFAVFNLFDPNLPADIRNWLVTMDVPLDEIPQIIRQLGRSMRKVMDEK